MKTVKENFLQGFREGWDLFYSPFAGILHAVQDLWADRTAHKHHVVHG